MTIIISPYEFIMEGMVDEHINLIIDVINWRYHWEKIKNGKNRKVYDMQKG